MSLQTAPPTDVYRDFASKDMNQAMQLVCTGDSIRHKIAKACERDLFPTRLHDMIEACSNDRVLSRAIQWLPHGRAFVLYDRDLLVQLTPHYFHGLCKFASFQRQLGNYGFLQLRGACDKGVFYHELFLRGRPDLSRLILPTRNSPSKSIADNDRAAVRRKLNTRKQPEFSRMSILPPSTRVPSLPLGAFPQSDVASATAAVTTTVVKMRTPAVRATNGFRSASTFQPPSHASQMSMPPCNPSSAAPVRAGPERSSTFQCRQQVAPQHNCVQQQSHFAPQRIHTTAPDRTSNTPRNTLNEHQVHTGVISRPSCVTPGGPYTAIMKQSAALQESNWPAPTDQSSKYADPSEATFIGICPRANTDALNQQQPLTSIGWYANEHGNDFAGRPVGISNQASATRQHVHMHSDSKDVASRVSNHLDDLIYDCDSLC